MKERTNADRSKKIGKILQFHYDPYGPEENVTDVLTDLRHYCDKHKLDFAKCDRMAYQHYLAERNGRE